jgi:hypothetical protein
MVVSTREFGDMSEKKLAKKVNGQVTKGSGSCWDQKGDVLVVSSTGKKYLFQNKATAKSYFPITMKLLAKIQHDANTRNADAVLSMNIQNQWVFCFDRALVSEKCEAMINPTPTVVNQQLTVGVDQNFLLNDRWLVVTDWLFEHYAKKELKL